MAVRSVKRKHSELYRQHLDLRLALGILSVFALLVSIYLIASCSRLVSSLAVSIESTAAVSTRGQDATAVISDSNVIKFVSQDDFKSFIDDGKRLYGDGLFEAQSLSPLIEAAKQVVAAPKSPAVAAGAKAQVASVKLDPETMKKYFSLLGAIDPGIPNIAQMGAAKIYFSSENQYYPGAFSADSNADAFPGQTKVITALPAESLAQSETIPADGNVLLAEDSLMVFLGNSLVAYNSDSVFGRQEIWRARVNDGSKILTSRLMGGNLYLAVETAIDMANPCPIKPLTAGEEVSLVKCSDVYHPKTAMLADSIITVFRMSPATGKVDNSASFVVQSSNAAVEFSETGIYAAWGQGGDYVSFFSGFLNEKCKSLIPNYILEKAVKLGNYNISLLAKELELRSMMMNWLATLSDDEQARITGEISSRMVDYLEGNYQSFEQTRVARMDLESFKFVDSAEVSGLISDPTFVDFANGYLRIMTVSGRGSLQKMEWLVTGQTEGVQLDRAANNVNIFDANLKSAGSASNLNIPQSVCAVRFAEDIAYVSACDGDTLHLVNLSLAEDIGLAGEIGTGSNDFYIYPLKDRQLLVVSKNKRNIGLSLYDNNLAAKPEKRSEYQLSDYWADLDGNYRAFAADDANKIFFLPVGRGGYVFFYNNGLIELQKEVGDFMASRVFLKDGSLYILSESGVQIFGAPEWSKAGELEFENN